jgi:hypothetical protein
LKIEEPYLCFDFVGIFVEQGGANRKRYTGRPFARSLRDDEFIDTVNPFRFTVESIETEFVVDIDGNKNTTHDAEHEAENIDERIEFILQDAADGNSDVVTKHSVRKIYSKM